MGRRSVHINQKCTTTSPKAYQCENCLFHVFLPRVSESLEILHRIYVVIRQNYGMKKISVYFSFYGDVGKLIESQLFTQSYPPNYLS